MLDSMTTDMGAWGAIPPETMAHRLQRAREYAGMRQTALAAALQIDVKTVSRYETGGVTKRSTVMAWALATGVNLHWLETGEAPSSPGGDDGASGAARPEGLEPPTFWLGALAAAA
jgi:transcriptional regulator with XRE-family HTH domain